MKYSNHFYQFKTVWIGISLLITCGCTVKGIGRSTLSEAIQTLVDGQSQVGSNGPTILPVPEQLPDDCTRPKPTLVGNGSLQTPYLVFQANLAPIIGLLNSSPNSDVSFLQCQDLDWTGQSSILIFSGIWNGSGFKISNISVTNTDPDDPATAVTEGGIAVGWIRLLRGGTIKNTQFINVQITGEQYVGLVGMAYKDFTRATPVSSRLENLSLDSTSRIVGHNSVGSLVGIMPSGTVQHISSAATVAGRRIGIGNGDDRPSQIGGVIGNVASESAAIPITGHLPTEVRSYVPESHPFQASDIVFSGAVFGIQANDYSNLNNGTDLNPELVQDTATLTQQYRHPKTVGGIFGSLFAADVSRLTVTSGAVVRVYEPSITTPFSIPAPLPTSGTNALNIDRQIPGYISSNTSILFSKSSTGSYISNTLVKFGFNYYGNDVDNHPAPFYFGGIAGRTEYSRIDTASFAGTVDGGFNTGGISGYSRTGVMSGIRVESTAVIMGLGGLVGGLVGDFDADRNINVIHTGGNLRPFELQISNIVMNGTVAGETQCTIDDCVTPDVWATGGLIGRLKASLIKPYYFKNIVVGTTVIWGRGLTGGAIGYLDIVKPWKTSGDFISTGSPTDPLNTTLNSTPAVLEQISFKGTEIRNRNWGTISYGPIVGLSGGLIGYAVINEKYPPGGTATTHRPNPIRLSEISFDGAIRGYHCGGIVGSFFDNRANDTYTPGLLISGTKVSGSIQCGDPFKLHSLTGGIFGSRSRFTAGHQWPGNGGNTFQTTPTISWTDSASAVYFPGNITLSESLVTAEVRRSRTIGSTIGTLFNNHGIGALYWWNNTSTNHLNPGLLYNPVKPLDASQTSPPTRPIHGSNTVFYDRDANPIGNTSAPITIPSTGNPVIQSSCFNPVQVATPTGGAIGNGAWNGYGLFECNQAIPLATLQSASTYSASATDWASPLSWNSFPSMSAGSPTATGAWSRWVLPTSSSPRLPELKCRCYDVSEIGKGCRDTIAEPDAPNGC